MIEERFEDGFGVIQGQADAQGHQEGHEEDFLHPCFGIKLPLCAGIEHACGEGGGGEDRYVDEDGTPYPMAKAAGGGLEEHAEEGEEQVGEIRGEMRGRLDLDPEGQFALPDAWKELLAGLDGALGPAVLLAFEAVHVNGQLGGGYEIGQEDKFPTLHLRPVAEVEVFGQGVVLPSAGGLDAGAAPETGGAVEVEETPAAAARGLFQEEMAVQEHGLNPREEGVGPVQVAPAGLEHPDFGVGEMVDRVLQDIGMRHEVGVEDEDELALAGIQTGLQGSGLEALSVDAVNKFRLEPFLPQLQDAGGGDVPGVVGRVIQNLNLKKFPGIVERGHRLQEALDDVILIIYRELDGDLWQGREDAPGDRKIFAVLEEEVDDRVAMKAVKRQPDEDDQITSSPNNMSCASMHTNIISLALFA